MVLQTKAARAARDRLTFFAGLIVLAAAAFLAIEELFDPGTLLGYDLGAYLGAARRIVAGAGLYPEIGNSFRLGPYGQYLYPPPLAVALVPLAALPIQTAVALWTGFLGVVAVATLLHLVRPFTAAYRPWLMGLGLLYLPLVWDVRDGNTALLTLALCWAAWSLRDRPRLAGVLFAVALGLKLLPATLALFLIASGRWRIVAWAGVAGLAAIALTWPLVGSAWVDYVAVLTAIAGAQPAAGSNVVPSIFGSGLGRAVLPLAAAALALGAGWAARRSTRETAWFCVALAAAPFMSATVWYPYLTLALPLLLFVGAAGPLAAGTLRPGRTHLALVGAAWLALMLHGTQQVARDLILPFYAVVALILALVLRPTVVSHLRAPRPLLAPIAALSRPVPRLFLTSAAVLFVELVLIRWIPANVTYVGFFSNFILIGSFLGIGLGILLGRRFDRLPASPFAPLLAILVALVLAAQLNVQVRSTDEIFFGLAESNAADVNFVVLPLVVLLVTAVMAAIALPLGGLLRSMPPLRAYAVDIAGAIAGIAAFLSLSAAGLPPEVWFLALGALILVLALGRGVTTASVLGGACFAAVLVMQTIGGAGDTWSPYYRISRWAWPDGSPAVSVNGIAHQSLFADDSVHREPFYDQVYKWFPERRFSRVLIVGAGGGNDVRAALAHGADRVDAVEIDPRLLEIGRAEHPEAPYADPRVRPFVNDGRAFLRSVSEPYDLVVFALPDSLTLMSTTANVRLESYLFTTQAFASVRDVLSDDGVFVLYNYYRQPWLLDKLGGMLAEVFGAPPLLRTYEELGTAAVLAAGPGTRNVALGDESHPLDLAAAPRPATDHWPFLYLREPTIAPHYVLGLGFVLLLAVMSIRGALRASGIGGTRLSPHFFILGTAFLLLETRSLATFGLLFGTTWWVNGLVFAAILTSVLAAIAVNARFRPRSPRLLYAGLFGSLGLGYFLPPDQLLFEPAWLRYAAAAVLAFAPVFFANLVFTHSFAGTKAADVAFASNMLGAVVGGVLEYAALLVGFRELVFFVVVLYLLAYGFATRLRLLEDRGLVDERLIPAGAEGAG